MTISFVRISSIETQIHCHSCNTPLFIERTDTSIYMYCSFCKKLEPIASYITQSDEVMENFLGDISCNKF